MSSGRYPEQTMGPATASSAGSMSAADKALLDAWTASGTVMPFIKRTESIDLRSAAATEVIPRAVGKRFFLVRSWAVIRTKTSATGTATVNIGGATGGAIPSTLAVGNGTFAFCPDVTDFPTFRTFDVDADGVDFTVTVTAGGTAFVCDVWVLGWYY